MTALIIVMPIIRIERYTVDALEQRDRQYAAQIHAQETPPPRTRPLLVVDNVKPKLTRRPRGKRKSNGR